MSCSLDSCVFKKMITFRQHNQFTDVTFVFGGDRLKAHKNVLSCRSDVFEVMFTSPMTENTCGEVVITDASKEAFEMFLDYLYLNSFDAKNIKDHYEELLYLSDKYFVEGLRHRCIKEIESLVESGNLIYLLEVAYSFNIETVRKTAVDFIFDHNEEFFETEEWNQLSTDFKLSNIVLSNLPPATVSMTWCGILDKKCIFQTALNKNFTVRNNGNRFCGRVEVVFAFSTVYIYISVDDRTISNRPLEISYNVSVSTSANCVIRSTKGNHWWPDLSDCNSDGHRRRTDELRRSLCDFDCNLDENTELGDTLYFSVTLTQWDRPDRVLKKPPDNPDPPKPPRSRKRTRRGVIPPAVDVIQFYSTVQKPVDKRITRATYEKIRRHWTSRAMPEDGDVDTNLIYAARQYSCAELQRHCENVIASKLTVNNAVETLIQARETNLEVLESGAVKFIDLHHLEVMATDSWNNLTNHSNLVASILKKVLSKPPDFKPFSEEPHPKLSFPFDNCSELGSEEEEGSGSSYFFDDDFDTSYDDDS